MAKVMGRDLSISTKQAIEICNHLRKRTVPDAKQRLEAAIALQSPIPFRRFMEGAGHKPGMGGGKYAVRACKTILGLLQSLETNAQQKGLNTTNLVITHIHANRAGTAWHYGRRFRRKMKRTHVEVVAEEQAAVLKQTKEQKPTTQQVPEQQKAPVKETHPAEGKQGMAEAPVTKERPVVQKKPIRQGKVEPKRRKK